MADPGFREQAGHRDRKAAVAPYDDGTLGSARLGAAVVLAAAKRPESGFEVGMSPVCRRIGFAHQAEFGEPGQDLTQLLDVFAFSERKQGVDGPAAVQDAEGVDDAGREATRDDGVPGIEPDLNLARAAFEQVKTWQELRAQRERDVVDSEVFGHADQHGKTSLTVAQE
jgi:hypothetical protein